MGKMGLLLAAYGIAVLLLMGPSVLVSADGGPCSKTQVTIPCFSSSDFSARFSHPSTQTVQFVLQNDILLNSPLNISGPSFACTVITSKQGSQFSLTTQSDGFPAVTISRTSNIWIHGVSISINLNLSSPKPCPLALPLSTRLSYVTYCPAILVHSSWGIQIVQSSVFGRLDVFSATQALFDSLQITTLSDDRAAVRFAYVGDGPNLVKSLIALSNSRIEGGETGVLLNRFTVGVTVANNDLVNQYFTGIECGERRSMNAGDCMLNSLVNNFIHADYDHPVEDDSSAIYFSTHWLNPGNYLSCNYATGALVQCFYLDWASSGITIDGGVCFNLTSGVKLNTGHKNSITSVLVIQANLPGWISCQNYFSNNCLQEPALTWERVRLANYSSPLFQQTYPWLDNICGDTEVGDIPCNPNDGIAPGASITGNCSGLPTNNTLQLTIISPRKRVNTPTYLSCTSLTTVLSNSLNSLDWITYYNATKASFNNITALDYGLKNDSTIYNSYPNFRSCPKSLNGIQIVNPAIYTKGFNILPGSLVPSLVE